MTAGHDRLADRSFDEPAVSRLPLDHPNRDAVLAAHRVAMERDQAGYLDPSSSLFVLTAAYLADRGYCCEQGCRHCPYTPD